MKIMKTKILSLLGLLAIEVTAAYGSQTPQPKMNGKLIVDSLAPEDVRYTGKPYSKALGAYVFNYRNYDPQISRWTTSDPSGFPDGANNRLYVSNNTLNTLDIYGLFDTATFAKGATEFTAGIAMIVGGGVALTGSTAIIPAILGTGSILTGVFTLNAGIFAAGSVCIIYSCILYLSEKRTSLAGFRRRITIGGRIPILLLVAGFFGVGAVLLFFGTAAVMSLR